MCENYFHVWLRYKSLNAFLIRTCQSAVPSSSLAEGCSLEWAGSRWIQLSAYVVDELQLMVKSDLVIVCNQLHLVAGHPLHASFHHRWPSVSGCCRLYLEWSASAHQLGIRITSLHIVSDIAVFVLKRDVKLQPTNQPCILYIACAETFHFRHYSRPFHYFIVV